MDDSGAEGSALERGLYCNSCRTLDAASRDGNRERLEDHVHLQERRMTVIEGRQHATTLVEIRRDHVERYRLAAVSATAQTSWRRRGARSTLTTNQPMQSRSESNIGTIPISHGSRFRSKATRRSFPIGPYVSR